MKLLGNNLIMLHQQKIPRIMTKAVSDSRTIATQKSKGQQTLLRGECAQLLLGVAGRKLKRNFCVVYQD